MKGVYLFSSDFAGFIATLCLLATASSGYTLPDDKVGTDIHPMLGRGYANVADKFLSTCLVVDEAATTLTRNEEYDYVFTDLTSSQDSASEVDQKLSYSLGYSAIKDELANAPSYRSTSKVRTAPYFMVTTVRIEREHFISNEPILQLSGDASDLLGKKDYIGFSTVCGPNYVQSIRYAQEVTAIFKFTSASKSRASQFAAGFSAGGGFWGFSFRVESSFSSRSKFSSIQNSLEIKILGFGLELDEEGSESLVVTSLEEYNQVIEYALNSFKKAEGARTEIGEVIGVDTSRWVDNEIFQNEIDINNIQIPLPLVSIPKAENNGIEASPSNFNSGTRDDFSCVDNALEVDQYGFCCSSDKLYNREEKEYDSITPSERICRPLDDPLNTNDVKNNLHENGEFVVQLDVAMQYRLNQISFLQNCIFSARSFPDDEYDSHILKPQNDDIEENMFTLAELKLALDPFGDYSLLEHIGKEHNEYMDMFYHPCIAALKGSTINDWSDTDGNYFMARRWDAHGECTHSTCLGDDMRWERESGGCISSLITGSSADYQEGETKCSIDVDSSNECKYPKNELVTYRNSIASCWDHQNFPRVDIKSPNYVMLHFCQPELTGEKVDSTKKGQLDGHKNFCAAI